MPAFFCCSACAASCQVRPSEPSWCMGRSSAQVWKTFVTPGSVHGFLWAIRSTWYWYPLIRRLSTSNVPIAGQPSLSANAIGISPSDFIFVARVFSSSSVFGTW